MVENIKGYDEAGDEVELDGEGIGYALEVLPVNRLDLNQDGVVGAGDVALAETEEQKKEIAEVAAIYPYKRALVITMDGAGKAYDPDQQYLCDESTNSYDVVSDLGTLRPKDGYAMQLFNNEFAMSYTAQATDPPISAQNYCTITHGIPWKSLPSKYQFTNDIAGATLWPDYGLEMPQYPSMFWVIKNQQPERKLFAVAEWNPITNGILEQDVGTYFQYRASTAQNPLCFDQLEEYIQDGRFKDTALTYMQSDTMDHYGHASGYFTEGYYEELKQFDGHFKKIVEAMKEQNLYEDTFFVINADHGGHRNANGTGSHGDPSRDVDMDIMIGARGQTVPAGKRLSGGNNKDIAAMVLSALRLEKPDSMSQSEVFDSSLFLAQEEMASKERTVEKVSFNKQGNRATITVSNQQDQAIKALDTVIALEGRSVDAVTPGAGIGVVRQKEEDGKLYLTLAGENLNGTVAEIAFSDGVNSSFAMQEVMLGAEDGSEIYSDLENQENGSVVISGSGEIKGESYLIQNGADLQSSYEAVFRKPSGEELAVQEDAVIWSVEDAEEIRLPENAVGLETTVTVAPTVPSGTVFTLKANYKGIVAQKEVTVMARAALPDSVLQAVETKITFDNGIDAEIGTTPTVSGSMAYGEGIRGKSGVFTKGNYLDFGNVDLKNKSIVFTLKSNRFTGVKDPVILANKDWNSASGAGFVYAYAWNRTSDYKTRIGDGSEYQDVTFPYTGQEWLNVALIFNTEQGKYDVYLDGDLVESFDTSGFETGWQNGAYSLKLGNDGTGKYSANSAQESDYEFEIDEFMIVNKVLTPEEVAVVNLAQVQAPERTMAIEGAASITAPASAQEKAVTQTYTASFYNAQEEKVTVADPQNIRWTLSGATEQVTIPETSTGTTVDVTVLYGAAEQIINLTAVYQGSDGTVCQANLQVSVLEANQIPKSIEFVEVPEKLVVEVPQPGGAPVKLKFRAVAKGASGVELQDYVLDADHYCLLENPSSQSASIEMVEEIVDGKPVTYAVVSITDKAYALEKLTLVAYVTEPDSQPNARQEITLTANRQPKQIVIVGAGSVNVKNASAQVQYTASLLDQYGQTMDSNIVWKVEKADMSGVGISTDGRLTVQQGAESGNIVISATAEETGLKATKTVVVYGPGNTIGGGGGGRPGSGGSGGGAVVVTGPDNGTENGSQAENGTPSGQLWDRFSDLPAGHWAENAIVSLMAKGIISGDGGSHTIRPEENISREETVKIILGVIGASILPAGNETVDPGTSEWAKEYMLTAKKSGIIKGDEAGNLNGQQPVTRVDAMVMVARAWNVGEGNTALLNQFTDGWLIPDYAKGAVARLIELGIVEGYEDGTIGAGSNITRAEMFVLADRIS